MLSNPGQGVTLLVALAVSLLFIAFFVKSRLNFWGIPKLIVRPGGTSTPDCMVIVPARNEEEAVE